MSIKKNQNKKNEILSVRVSKVMKNKWIKFAEKHGYTRLSIFIRDLIMIISLVSSFMLIIISIRKKNQSCNK